MSNGVLRTYSNTARPALPTTNNRVPSLLKVKSKGRLSSVTTEKTLTKVAVVISYEMDKEYSEISSFWLSIIYILLPSLLNDKLLGSSLDFGSSGGITALANLRSPDLRKIWDDFNDNKAWQETQKKLDAARSVLDGYSPAPAFVKAMLHKLYEFDEWELKTPLVNLEIGRIKNATKEMQEFGD